MLQDYAILENWMFESLRACSNFACHMNLQNLLILCISVHERVVKWIIPMPGSVSFIGLESDLFFVISIFG